MHIVVYILAGLFLALTLGLIFAYFRERRVGLIFMAMAYGGAAGAALAYMEWWPLVAGFVIAWLVRFAGLDPEAPRSPRSDSAMDDRGEALRRLGRLAWLLDNSIPIPGTRYRIGLDAIIGLIPGLGDVIGVLLSSYIVREAAQLGVPPSVLTRMAFNVAVEGLVGLVPVLGDVFDAAWKANQRNLTLLEGHFREPRRTSRSSRIFVAALLAALICFIVLTAAAAVLIVRLLWQAFS